MPFPGDGDFSLGRSDPATASLGYGWGVDLPHGYLSALRDELAPFGLEFSGLVEEPDGVELRFRADPDSFAQAHPDLELDAAFAQWPPEGLYMRIRIDQAGDPTQVDFETIDLMSQTALTNPELRDRLNTLADPADHAAAVGEAFGEALVPGENEDTGYLE